MKKLMLIATMLLSLTLSAQTSETYTYIVQNVTQETWNPVTKKYTLNWSKDFPGLTAMITAGQMYISDDAGTSFTTTRTVTEDKVTWTNGVKKTESHFVVTDEEGIECSLFMTYYSNKKLVYMDVIYRDLTFRYSLRPIVK
jgi:hypothetical protein